MPKPCKLNNSCEKYQDDYIFSYSFLPDTHFQTNNSNYCPINHFFLLSNLPIFETLHQGATNQILKSQTLRRLTQSSVRFGCHFSPKTRKNLLDPKIPIPIFGGRQFRILNYTRLRIHACHVDL